MLDPFVYSKHLSEGKWLLYICFSEGLFADEILRQINKQTVNCEIFNAQIVQLNDKTIFHC